MSIKDIAILVKKVVEEKLGYQDIEIVKTPSDDNRSYHINSDKIKNKLNFIPKFTIEDAIDELCEAFNKKLLPNSFDDDFYFNVKRLQRIQAE